MIPDIMVGWMCPTSNASYDLVSRWVVVSWEMVVVVV